MTLSLSNSDKDELLYIHKNLIVFTNKKFNIYDKFKTIQNVVNLSQKDIRSGILEIRKKMYDASNIKDFCGQSDVLNENQKNIAKSWSMAYTDDFYVIKHLKDNTILLTGNEKKLYGIVGISNGLDEFFPDQVLPMLVNTTLLPFKEQIVYDGFFTYHNIHFGGNITRRLKQVYSTIKGEEGIIIQPDESINIGDLEPNKSDDEAIKFFIKQELKKNLFPTKAWSLAKKNLANRLLFEHEYARIFAKDQVNALKNYDEIKPMYYAAYRSCIIGVADTKKSLMTFCEQHYPKIFEYLYIFKS